MPADNLPAAAELDALERLHREATPGPWESGPPLPLMGRPHDILIRGDVQDDYEVDDDGNETDEVCGKCCTTVAHVLGNETAGDWPQNNAAFIVAANANMPALIAAGREALRLRKAVIDQEYSIAGALGTALYGVSEEGLPLWGDHVAETLAVGAAREVVALRAEVAALREQVAAKRARPLTLIDPDAELLAAHDEAMACDGGEKGGAGTCPTTT
jgi:hypothetical protein